MAVSRFRCLNPRFPFSVGQTYGDFVLPSNERLLDHKGFLGQFIKPAAIVVAHRTQPEIRVSSCGLVDQSRHTKFLREALQFAFTRWPIIEVHKMHLDPALTEESQRFLGIRTFISAENLNFHGGAVSGQVSWVAYYYMIAPLLMPILGVEMLPIRLELVQSCQK